MYGPMFICPSITDCIRRQTEKKPGHYLYHTENWVVRSSDGDISIDKAKEIVRFMRRCLRLGPADRASAKELLQDEWFDDAA